VLPETQPQTQKKPTTTMMHLARSSSAVRRSVATASRAQFSSGLTFDQHPFLARLGLEEENLGCWNGKEWVGDGSTHTSMNPATGEPVARVKFGTTENYEQCLKNMHEVRLIHWLISLLIYCV
jgi:hypothetical protein